jgi:hypothetical protein
MKPMRRLLCRLLYSHRPSVCGFAGRIFRRACWCGLVAGEPLRGPDGRLQRLPEPIPRPLPRPSPPPDRD